MSNTVIDKVFGNLEFFETQSYSYYWKTRYRITRNQIEIIFSLFLYLFLGMMLIQIIVYKFSLEFLITEVLIFFISLRLITFFVRQDLKNFTIKAEIIGYFVLHELLIILETTKSLKDATKFIVNSNYYLYSDIFRESLFLSHFGIPLKKTLRTQINRTVSGELKRIFLNVIDTWDTGSEITHLSTKMVLSHLSEYIKEETDKVDTWGSLFSGLIFLSPPVIICFLLLSGQLSYLVGLMIIIFLLIGSLVFRPDRHLAVFTGQSSFLPFTDDRTIEFLVILAEHLSSGKSFTKSINKALSIFLHNSPNDVNSSLKEFLFSFRLGIGPSSFIDVLNQILSSRPIQILSLVEKFCTFNTKLAGAKLLVITNELSKTGSLLRLGKARLRATAFQAVIIQILSIISLAFISGASPFFQLIHLSVEGYNTQTANVTNFDPLFLLFGFILSFSPLSLNFSSEEIIQSISVVIIRLSRFFLFTAVFIISRGFLTVSF